MGDSYQRVRKAIKGYCKNFAPQVQAYYLECLDLFYENSLPNAQFKKEITSGSRPKFLQRLWEMVVARRLIELNHDISTSNNDDGPDFQFRLGEKTVWVEATAPQNSSCSRDQCGPNNASSSYIDSDLVTLRWTNRLDEKVIKLNRYLKKKCDRVKLGDVYVIAIYGGMLPDFRGDSGYPYLVESAYGIGRKVYTVDSDRFNVLDVHLERQETIIKNNIPVSKAWLLDPLNKNLNAIIGAENLFHNLPFVIAHNPHNPAPIGIFGLADEYTYEDGQLRQMSSSG